MERILYGIWHGGDNFRCSHLALGDPGDTSIWSYYWHDKTNKWATYDNATEIDELPKMLDMELYTIIHDRELVINKVLRKPPEELDVPFTVQVMRRLSRIPTYWGLVPATEKQAPLQFSQWRDPPYLPPFGVKPPPPKKF